MTALAAALLSGATFAGTALNSNDLQQMHETYTANQARFAHDYVGKTFAASLLVSNITENLLNRGSYLVTLGSNSDISCSGVTGDEALAFNKEDTVNVSGVIYDHTFGVINLNHCVFSRSVPVIQQPQVSTVRATGGPSPATPSSATGCLCPTTCVASTNRFRPAACAGPRAGDRLCFAACTSARPTANVCA
jgi:hypothetical protein